MIIEIVREIHQDDLFKYEADAKHLPQVFRSVRVLSSKEWPETGQSAYKLIRSKGEASTPR